MFNKILDIIPQIPVAEYTKKATDWLTSALSFLFDPIKEHFGNFMDWTSDTLYSIPPIFVILFVAILAFFLSGKKFGLSVFSIVGLWFIYNQGLWEMLTFTFTLVLLASILSIIIGIPFGILMSKSRIAEAI